MVAIQIVSDLHLESPKAYDVFTIPPKAPYLALLGDIGCTQHADEYLGFIRRHLPLFKAVFLVLGNHEPWHSDWETSKILMREYQRSVHEQRRKDPTLGEFVFLDQSTYTVDEQGSGSSVTFLGCTLFSRVPAESMETVSSRVNDFYLIDGWTVEQHNEAFRRDLSWLNSQVVKLRETGTKVVILTHYSPTLDDRAVDPRHRSSPLTSGFATDLSSQPCWTSEHVKLWSFGHNHFNCDFTDHKNGIRAFTNQRGYYFNQSQGFEADKVVKI